MNLRTFWCTFKWVTNAVQGEERTKAWDQNESEVDADIAKT